MKNPQIVLMAWRPPNRATDGLVTILGPPLFIIMGLVMLNNKYLSTTINPAFGFGLILLGVALPILSLMMLRAPDSEDTKALELDKWNFMTMVVFRWSSMRQRRMSMIEA